MEMETFRILSLYILGHKVLGTNTFIFDNDYESEDSSENEVYSTVIIGANGIGKSFLLKVIVDIFNYIYDLNHAEKIPRSLGYSFRIDYICNGHRYTVGNIVGEKVRVNSRLSDKVFCNRDNISTGIHNCELPEAVIASAMTVSDKFVIRGERDRGTMYCYQGIRNEKSPSTTGTRTLIRKTVTGLIKCLKHKGGFRGEISLLLRVLNFRETLKIRYSLRYIDEFVGNASVMTPQLLKDIFDRKNGHFQNRETDLWGKRKFDTIRDDENKLWTICDFYHRIANSSDVAKERCVITYDIFDDRIEQDSDAILLMSELDLLSFPTLLVQKEEQYDFSESSSGETHLLCQMIGIMSEIKRGSLILIDEPETSSHPNWQIKYIEWLREIFKEYYSCHFIISTHSHFLLSDIKPNSSTIIALARDESDGSLRNIGEGLSTYCWSTDDILYRVFHVRNTRNWVFEKKVAELYDRISRRDKDISSIQSLIAELSSYQLNDGDPLKRLISLANNYVASY